MVPAGGSEPIDFAEHAFAAGQLAIVFESIAVHSHQSAERRSGPRRELEAHGDAGTRNPPIDHQEVVVVLPHVNTPNPRVLQPVFDAQLGPSGRKPHALVVSVAVSGGIGQLVQEFHSVPVARNGPTARIDDLIGPEPSVFWLLGFADGAHAHADKTPAFRSLVISNILEFLNRSGDRIVAQRVVALEPGTEVVVPLKFKRCNHARPVEPRAAVVSLLSVRQVERGPNQTIGDLGGRKRHRLNASPASRCWSRMAKRAARKSPRYLGQALWLQPYICLYSPLQEKAAIDVNCGPCDVVGLRGGKKDCRSHNILRFANPLCWNSLK